MQELEIRKRLKLLHPAKRSLSSRAKAGYSHALGPFVFRILWARPRGALSQAMRRA